MATPVKITNISAINNHRSLKVITEEHSPALHNTKEQILKPDEHVTVFLYSNGRRRVIVEELS